MRNPAKNIPRVIGLLLALGGLILNGSPVSKFVKATIRPSQPDATLSIPGWNLSSNLNKGRLNHTATLLPNGKVPVAGGPGTDLADARVCRSGRCNCDHRPLRPDRRNRPVHEIGGGIRLDDETGELYTYISTGLGSRQIRLMDDLGIAGAVFHSGVGEIAHDAYADPRFHRDVDEQTAYTTKSLLCAPVRNAKGETIGVAEMLNKVDGTFEANDLTLLERMTSQCAITLEALQRLERTTRERQREVDFLNLVSDLTSELELTTLLSRVVSEATRMLPVFRSSAIVSLNFAAA